MNIGCVSTQYNEQVQSYQCEYMCVWLIQLLDDVIYVIMNMCPIPYYRPWDTINYTTQWDIKTLVSRRIPIWEPSA